MVSRITDTAHDPSVRGQVRTYNAGVVDNAGAVRYVGGRVYLIQGGDTLARPRPLCVRISVPNHSAPPPVRPNARPASYLA